MSNIYLIPENKLQKCYKKKIEALQYARSLFTFKLKKQKIGKLISEKFQYPL